MTAVENFFSSLNLSDEQLMCNENMLACLEAFDKDGDGELNIKEFIALLDSLFTNADGVTYPMPTTQQLELFFIFDKNRDGRLDVEEFSIAWYKWMKVILQPVSAFLVVDVQNDFISGSLAIKHCPARQDGFDVVPVINKILDTTRFHSVVYSLDWHPEDHVSFVENIDMRPLDVDACGIPKEHIKVFDTVVFEGPIEQKLWPRHCVQNSWGAELHPEMRLVKNHVLVYKGTRSDIDSYSAFWDNQKRSHTTLGGELSSRGITDVYVCGLAYDVCVGSSALHSLEMGYRTILVDDASKGVDENDILSMQQRLRVKNGLVIQSDVLDDMVRGRDRRPELGYHYALTHLTNKIEEEVTA